MFLKLTKSDAEFVFQGSMSSRTLVQKLEQIRFHNSHRHDHNSECASKAQCQSCGLSECVLYVNTSCLIIVQRILTKNDFIS